MTSIIADALQTPSRETQRDVAVFANTTIVTNPTVEAAGRLNVACQSLIRECDAFETMVADMAGENKNPIAETWAREVQETERLLKLGHRIAVRRVKRVLGADGEDGTEAVDQGGEGEREEGGLGYGLLRSLRYAERGVKRMVKGLPVDASD